jgi:hypothetical protein
MAKYGEVQLGDRVMYPINKFEGIVVGITEYLHQCRQVLVKPEKLTADGSQIDMAWIDEPWLNVVAKKVYQPTGAVNEEVAHGAQAPRSGAESTHHTPITPRQLGGA